LLQEVHFPAVQAGRAKIVRRLIRCRLLWRIGDDVHSSQRDKLVTISQGLNRFKLAHAIKQRGSRALDAEAGLSGNPARILELVGDEAVSASWERLNGRDGAASFRWGDRA
jgi:hypothetical protein